MTDGAGNSPQFNLFLLHTSCHTKFSNVTADVLPFIADRKKVVWKTLETRNHNKSKLEVLGYSHGKHSSFPSKFQYPLLACKIPYLGNDDGKI